MVLKLNQFHIKKDTLILVVILILSFVIRFWGLGYSDFTGDETKTLYVDKTVPAATFLLDQRKGPIQFFAVWVMEKVTSSYSELWMRVPFAIAGFLSVFIFYLLVKKLFNSQISLLATTIFSFSGFNVAFSRTAQYQSFLVLFGLLAVLLAWYALENKKNIFYTFTSLSLGLAFYCHYDAVFFAIPIIYLFIVNKVPLKNLILHFSFPFIFFILPFYLPYLLKGYMGLNTVGYFERRFTGTDYLRNNSLYTTCVYTPAISFFILLILGILNMCGGRLRRPLRNMLLIWFMVPFILFQFVFQNPGTHIHNYLIPLYILGAVILFSLKDEFLKFFALPFSIVISLSVIFISFSIFVPYLNKGYPYKTSLQKDFYQLFLYGFPYNRGWNEIAKYFEDIKDVNGVFTNDNDVVAKFYLRKFNYTQPGSNFIPQYYIHVFNNQEFVSHSPKFSQDYLNYYKKVKDFYVDGDLVAIVFKRNY